MPTVAPARRRIADLMERDRRRLELIGTRAAARIGTQARIAATRALRDGQDVAKAVRDALAEMAPLITDGMACAHLEGRRRTDIEAAGHLVQPKPDTLMLSDTAYTSALEWLFKRLALTTPELDHLIGMYGAEALKVTTLHSETLAQTISETITETLQKGYGVKEGVKALRGAFQSSGFEPGREYALENLFRTQTAVAYSAGQRNAEDTPEIQEAVWGYQYMAVMDDRTRPTHAAMDGVRAPKDHEVWRRWRPPCGYQCRCKIVQIWLDQKSLCVQTAIPDVEPDKGWGFDKGALFKDVIGR